MRDVPGTLEFGCRIRRALSIARRIVLPYAVPMNKVWAGQYVGEGWKCEGFYVEGPKKGAGVYSHRNGDRYEGAFANGVKSGEGAYFRANGDRYEGGYANDVYHGRGSLQSTFLHYNGDFRQGKRHGYGECDVYDNHYVGEFKNDAYDGRGVETGSNGRRFEGTFKAGKRDGFGIETWADGSRTEFTYKAGRKHGRCVEVFADGVRSEARYEHNQRVGAETITWKDGTRYVWMTNGGTYTWPTGETYLVRHLDHHPWKEVVFTWADRCQFAAEEDHLWGSVPGVFTTADGHRVPCTWRDGRLRPRRSWIKPDSWFTSNVLSRRVVPSLPRLNYGPRHHTSDSVEDY